MHGDDEAVLLELDHEGRITLLGLGDAGRVRALVGAAGHRRVGWMTIPRIGAGPAGFLGEPSDDGPRHSAEEDLDLAVQRRLGVGPASAWDWLVTAVRPTDVDPAVVRLDPAAEREAILDCLRESNPDTSADPGHPGEAAWFGVRGDGALLGVIGAGELRGAPEGGDRSWHLHGLGVRPAARGRGLGGALTAAATAAGLDAGADWVSLGMYASNTVARRVYERLGFTVEGRFTSYRAVAPVTTASAESPCQ